MTEKHWPIATFINVLTVAVGSIIGISLQQVFTTGIETIVFQAVGLGTLLIGLKMAWKLPDGYLLIFIFSLVLGGIVGEVLHVDETILAASEWLKESVSIGDDRFSEGLITAFLLFCIGSLTIIGALEEGLYGKRELILVKATLDGFSSIALAATFGWGIFFSIIPLLIFQGGITLLAKQLKPLFDEKTLNTLAAVGGILIVGIGINLLQIGDINLENLLPSLIVAVLLSKLYLLFLAGQKTKKQKVN